MSAAVGDRGRCRAIPGAVLVIGVDGDSVWVRDERTGQRAVIGVADFKPVPKAPRAFEVVVGDKPLKVVEVTPEVEQALSAWSVRPQKADEEVVDARQATRAQDRR